MRRARSVVLLVVLTAWLAPPARAAASVVVTLDEGFPETQIGQSSISSLEIRNSGDTSVTLGTVTFTGPSASEYSIDPETDCAGRVLAPGGGFNEVCFPRVRFAPSGYGTRAATANVNSTAPTATVSLAGVGGGPELAGPASLDFGNVQSGQTSPVTSATIVAFNRFQAPGQVTVGTVTATGSGAADYVLVDGCSGAVLQMNAQCTIGVRFAPTGSGARPMTLTIPSTAPTITIAVSGTAVAPAITLDRAALAFGNVQVGTTAPTRSVVVSNSGNGPATLSPVTKTGPAAADHTVTTDTCSGATLQPAATCTLTVRFTPTAVGARPATLTIASNAPTASVDLSGAGVDPSIAVAPSTLSFGNAQTGTTSSSRIVTVTNDGSGNGLVQVGPVTRSGSGASEYLLTDNCSGATLAPAQACTVSIRFAPSATGARPATLNVASNGPTATVALSGVGVAPSIALAPSSLSFGDVQLGLTATAPTITVTNDGAGNGPVTIASAALSGAGAGDYAVTDACSGATLSSGSSCTIDVTFAPSATGVRPASLSIASNAPLASVALSGTGVAPLAVDRSTLPFDPQKVGTSSVPRSVTVTNQGGQPLSIVRTLSGANPGEFSPDAGCAGATLSPGSSCSVNLSFAPTAAGVRSASLTFTAGGISVSTSLSGTGTVPVLAVAPSSLAFGEHEVGTTASPRALTIRNNGTADLVLSSVAVTGAAADFTATDTCPAEIAPGAACAGEIRFGPSAVGQRSGSLVVSSDGGTATVGLSGSGVDTTAPASLWATPPDSIRVSTLQVVNGTSSDNVGVASVKVTFTDLLGSPTVVDATLDCFAGGRTCQWSATVPLMVPGPVTATAQATDASGLREVPGPTVTLIVV